ATGGNFTADKTLIDEISQNEFGSVHELTAFIREWGETNNPLTGISFALQNIDVFGIRNTGGMIGFLTGTSTLTYLIEKSVSMDAYNSHSIKVHGRASTGGLMGKSNIGYVKVDMNNHTFNLTEVVCECTNRGGNYYDFGVGGFIGMIRAGQTSADLEANYFKNIVIGTEDKAQTVKCENADIFTAGVCGIMNKSKGITIENCTFYNLSVKAKFGAAGLVAFPTTWTPAKVTNTHLYSPLSSTIESTTDFAGGLIGSSDPRSGTGNGSQKFEFTNCSVEGYTISGKKGAGGVIGFRGAVDETYYLSVNNTKISDCTIKSDGSAGGLIGEMNQPVIGYNILTKDIEFESYTNNGSITNKGYICGRITTTSENLTYTNDTKGRKNTIPYLKLVGFSRQADDLSTMTAALVGSCNYGTDFTTHGYVIFADYDDTASSEPVENFSNVVTSGTNVDTMRFKEGSTTEKENYPFVTSSPEWVISGKNAQSEQYLTGDGVQGLVFSASRFKEIQDDIAKTGDDAVAKAYKLAPAVSSTTKDKNNNVISNPYWTEIADNYTTSSAAYSHIKGVSVPN
ncbi:MAG: hypothetical protein V3G42_16430, partial [Oscillospiraceae bacterium]